MNNEYFKLIDTPEKAYFLGLFHADGSCTKQIRNTYEELRFQISLQEQDRYILERFCTEINLPTSRVKIYRSNRENEQNKANLYISKKAFTLHLVDLKSESLQHRIPENLKPDFIRGFFDGDGSIYVRRNKNKILFYGVSYICLGWIGNYILSNIPVELKLRADKRTPNLFSIETNKKENIIKLYEYMYNTATTLKLERKYKKFKEAFEFASTTIPKGSRTK